MKTAFVSGLTILAAATALLTASVASADTSCRPRLIEKQTSFPLGSQIRGQEGTVYMNVVIDENGQRLSQAGSRGGAQRRRQLGVRRVGVRAQGSARDARGRRRVPQRRVLISFARRPPQLPLLREQRRRGTFSPERSAARMTRVNRGQMTPSRASASSSRASIPS